jgi:hypothetical protein
MTGQHTVAGQLLDLFGIARHLNADLGLQPGAVQPAPARGKQEHAAAQAERGAVELLAVFLDFGASEVAFAGFAEIDEAPSFVRKHVDPGAATLFLAGERDAVGVLDDGQPGHQRRAYHHLWSRVTAAVVKGGAGKQAVATRRSWLDLGMRGRATFAAVYLLVQVALVATVSFRPDKTFAFQMFNESSTVSIALSRRLAGPDGAAVVVPTNGRWQARDHAGVRHFFAWNDRIQDPILGTLGRPVAAAYGVDAQLFRLRAALDDVMAHIDEDSETRALIADVSVRKNGRDPFHERLESARPAHEAPVP